MNETERFLGDRRDWSRVRVELGDVHGLFGGTRLLVGNGLALVQVVEVQAEGLHQRNYASQVPASEGSGPTAVDELLEEIVESNFLGLVVGQRTGVPDEAWIAIRLTNAGGETREVGTWERTTQSPDSYGTSDRKRFDDVHLRLRHLLTKARSEENCVQEGPYDPDGWPAFCRKQGGA